MNDSNIINQLKAKAAQLGFGMLGTVSARPAKRLDAYLAWVDKEMHGKMGYLARPDRVIRRQNPSVILPGVETIICIGLDYHTLRLPEEMANDRSRGRISNYAWGADYHDIMTPRLEELAGWLKSTLKTNEEQAHRVYVDTGAILERDHAESAGLGFTGKNTMLIRPQSGSWFFLGEIMTTIKLPPTPFIPAIQMPSCGSCTRCLDACPTNAFPAPYVLDARRCISYLTIELKENVPEEMRPQMGNWVYGCDICQEVCPFNRFEEETVEHAFQAGYIDYAAPKLDSLLTLSQDAFDQIYAKSPIKRIKRERLLRNASIAAGNSGCLELIPALKVLLSDKSTTENEWVRSHATWALARLEKSD
ncbi:MAG: epoxyqueuosine reductase [Cellvibrionaceae bacterium]|jgi:epoxyqueuosine reductase